MNGQKVVKVFCHEEKAKEEFQSAAMKSCANNATQRQLAMPISYGPIMNNLGHLQYAVLPLPCGAMAIAGVPIWPYRGWAC